MKQGYFTLVFSIFLLVGCTDAKSSSSTQPSDSQSQPETKESEQENKKQMELEKVDFGTTKEDLIQQQTGKLTTEITFKEEATVVRGAHDVMKEEKITVLTKELKLLTEQTQDPEMLQKGLIYLLGSPHFKQAFEKAEELEPNFKEPLLPDPSKTDKEQEKDKSGKAIILLDASSSMLLQAEGKVKMDTAKEAVKGFAKTIGQNNEISLVVYGHKGSESDADKELSCTSIEAVYPMKDYEAESFNNSLDTVNAKGWTPLAGAIQKAADMSQSYEGNVTVYIVSDGTETCDGDPVKAAKSFTDDNKERTVNIIGFDVDKDAESQLSQVAEAGNGEFFAADSPEELTSTIEYEWLPSNIDLAWAHTMAPNGWEIIDERDRYDETLKSIAAIISKEEHRVKTAINIMKSEELVAENVIKDLEKMMEDHYEKVNATEDAFRKEKRSEVDQTAEEIKNNVAEWVEKMRKMKEEQGDSW